MLIQFLPASSQNRNRKNILKMQREIYSTIHIHNTEPNNLKSALTFWKLREQAVIMGSASSHKCLFCCSCQPNSRWPRHLDHSFIRKCKNTRRPYRSWCSLWVPQIQVIWGFKVKSSTLNWTWKPNSKQWSSLKMETICLIQLAEINTVTSCCSGLAEILNIS